MWMENLYISLYLYFIYIFIFPGKKTRGGGEFSMLCFNNIFNKVHTDINQDAKDIYMNTLYPDEFL